MINLLPNDKKAEIRAARTNVILVRYIVIVLLATAFILGALYVTKGVLASTKSSSEEVIASNDTKASVYSSTKAQVDALSTSLAGAKTLLDQQDKYSKVFVNLGQLMPAGTIFGKLSLTSSSFKGTLTTAKIYAKTTAETATLRQNFEKSSLLTSVNFQTVAETGSTVDGYPVSVDMTFILKKGASQ